MHFTNEISNGLYLDSSIPYGYGLGVPAHFVLPFWIVLEKHLPLQTEALFVLLKELGTFFSWSEFRCRSQSLILRNQFIENNQIQILSFNSEDFLKIHRIHLLIATLEEIQKVW